MHKKHFNGIERTLLADLIDSGSPVSVLREVEKILTMVYPGFDYGPVREVHRDVVDLYAGKYPGYRECNTGYHDLNHIMDVFLAMARLVHGVHVGGYTPNRRNITLGLISSLLHDTGYIQPVEDRDGTGGKYTSTHVERSVEFMDRYLKKKAYSSEDRKKCAAMIESTSLTADIEKIRADTEEVLMLCKMNFAADLMGQMADRVYLEKLHLLYIEFVEGGITEYKDDMDLLRKTIGFYDMINSRIRNELDDIDSYMRNHFRVRWDIDRDMYTESIENNIAYLKHILENYRDDYRKQLKRGGILDKLPGKSPPPSE